MDGLKIKTRKKLPIYNKIQNYICYAIIINMKLGERLILFTVAIFLCGLGIAVITRANLGTTPISSLPYVLTFMTPFSFGTTTFIINMIFLIGQILILKKDFKKINYLQILVTLFFGFFIDLGMHITALFKTNNYLLQLSMVIIGSMILALGVSLEVCADVIYVPGEGFVKAIVVKIGKNFGKIKIGFDVTHAIIAIILSLIVLHSIHGLREGTIISAFLVGAFVAMYNKIWNYFSTKFINHTR